MNMHNLALMGNTIIKRIDEYKIKDSSDYINSRLRAEYSLLPYNKRDEYKFQEYLQFLKNYVIKNKDYVLKERDRWG